MQKKVLAVDDEPDVLAFYTEVLEDNGFIPITAESALEGMIKAREEKPDLIILDIMMPKRSGVLMYKELKKDPTLESIPVIIITAIPKHVDFIKLLGKPGRPAPEGHLAKPVTPDDLMKVIRKVLG